MNEEVIKKWCQENGWTELTYNQGLYYALPPGAVIPIPIPLARISLDRRKKFWQYKGFITFGILMFFGFKHAFQLFDSLFPKYFSKSFFSIIVGHFLAFSLTLALILFSFFALWIEQNKTLKKDFPNRQANAILLGNYIALLISLWMKFLF